MLKETKSRRIHVVAGDALEYEPPSELQNPQARCILTGHNGWFSLDDTIFSKHLLVIGSIGSGKTNLIYQIVHQVQKSLRENDVLVIFDTKGDYLERFENEKSVVISNDEKAHGLHGPDYWNIFAEIMFRNKDPFTKRAYEDASNIVTSLFAEKLKKTNQPFFPQAARDILASTIICLLRDMYKKTKRPQDFLSNAVLRGLLDRIGGQGLQNLLAQYDDMGNARSYIAIAESPQTQGVLSELQQSMREFFIGNYSQPGSLSMRELVYNKGGVTVFVEYDIAYGHSLGPIFRLLLDLALEEAMGRNRSPGNVWIVIDEFSLLPNLNRLENALNFGRSIGLKILLGFQNFNQIIVSYEEAKGRSIASGCSTVFVFRIAEPKTKEYVQSLFGKQRRLEGYVHEVVLANSPGSRLNDGYVVEEWDLNLPVGECIVQIPGHAPFLYQTQLYDPQQLDAAVTKIRAMGHTNMTLNPNNLPFANLFR